MLHMDFNSCLADGVLVTKRQEIISPTLPCHNDDEHGRIRDADAYILPR